MAVISISITQSEDQLVSGIPKTITLSTNISSNIFYTLDGTDPSMFSTIYTGPISMPTEFVSITIKIFATNGFDSSPIISETYFTNMLQNARLPKSSTDAQAQSVLPDLYPYGTNPNQPQSHFLNPGNAGTTVNNQNLPSTSTGFDANGNQTGQTNKPFTFENYDIRYPTGDNQNLPLKVGQLPSNIKIIPNKNFADPPETTEQTSKLFDPRAFVIYQDIANEDTSKPPQINRANFSMEDNNRVRTGNNYFVAGLDAPPTTGAFLRQQFNPRDNTMTYYYYDQIANRWIISKAPYQPKDPDSRQLHQMKFSRNNSGAGIVWRWMPFMRRVLF